MTLHLGNVGSRRVELSDIERSMHVQVLGGTGSGKSRLMERCIRQDITAGRGLCLIDPHGELSNAVEEWAAVRGLGRTRKIHVVRPGSQDWTAGFNPLRIGARETASVRVDAMVSACAQVWGGQDLHQTPRLKKVLTALFFALASRDLTLADALFLLRSGDPDGTRQALTTALPDPVLDFVWGELNALTKKDFADYAESTVSRLTEFLSAPAVRLMLGQRANVLDFRQIMDEGHIVLVNLSLSTGLSRQNARVVGSLLVSELFLTALARDTKVARQRPFTLYMDEAHDFLNSDMGDILDQTRKFGLHAFFAHQRIGQLEERGVYNVVMGSARTKVVFGGLSDDDAGIMARELMREEIDLEEPKHILDKPTVVDDVPYWFESQSWSETNTRTSGSTEQTSWSEGESYSESAAEGYDERSGQSRQLRSSSDSRSGTSTRSVSGSSVYSESESESRTDAGSRTEGRIAVRKTLPTAVYSLEEQLHKGQAKLRGLPMRHAVVKRPSTRTVEMITAEVRPPLNAPPIVARFRTFIAETSAFISSTADAQAEMETRQAGLTRPAPQGGTDQFWEE